MIEMDLPGNASETVSQSISGNFVLVRAEQLRLLIPGNEVLGVGYFGGKLAPLSGTPGLLCEQDKDDGVIYLAVSERMKALVEPPKGRYLTTRFVASGDAMHWCWSEVRVIRDARYTACALPTMALGEDAPLREYLMVDGELVYLCDTNRLMAYALKPEQA